MVEILVGGLEQGIGVVKEEGEVGEAVKREGEGGGLTCGFGGVRLRVLVLGEGSKGG